MLPPAAAAAGAATCSSVHLQREGHGRSIQHTAGDKAAKARAHSLWRAAGAHPAKLCPTVSTLRAARCLFTVGSTFIMPIVRRYACRRQPATTLASRVRGPPSAQLNIALTAAKWGCRVGI